MRPYLQRHRDERDPFSIGPDERTGHALHVLYASRYSDSVKNLQVPIPEMIVKRRIGPNRAVWGAVEALLQQDDYIHI